MSEKKRSWDEVKDAILGTPWSDTTLLEVEQEWRRLGQVKNAELYRLARLGLAAEQVGREDMNDAVDETVFIDWDTMYGIERANLVRAFLNHEAWRK